MKKYYDALDSSSSLPPKEVASKDSETLVVHDTLDGNMAEVSSLEEARQYVKDCYVEGKTMHPDFASFDVYKKVGEVYVEEDGLGNAVGIKVKPSIGVDADLWEDAINVLFDGYASVEYGDKKEMISRLQSQFTITRKSPKQ